MSQDTVEGYVDHIIFRNEDNGYTVLNLIVKGSELTCVGTFEYVGEGGPDSEPVSVLSTTGRGFYVIGFLTPGLI